MNVLSITAGAAGMYCGSCLRDNAQAVELLRRGHQVTLLPLYTPTNPDERNVSRNQVLFGGISIYLQQYVPFFRKSPRFLDRLWDSPWIINLFASRSLSTDPRLLGEMTVSMLQGEHGVLRKEFDKLLEWLADEPVPDVVNLPNALLIALAAPLRRALKRPICCTLQGEDLFLDNLIEPYRTQALDLIARQVPDVDVFLSVCDAYVPTMSRMLRIPVESIAVVPLGIDLAGYERTDDHTRRDDLFSVGYFARVAPEKGLHVLAEAYKRLRARTPGARIRLDAAGYLPASQGAYLEEIKQSLAADGLAEEFLYHGAVDRAGKLSFLRSLDVMSAPATYDEPKGVSILEAMAVGVPVVQPRRGAFPEMVERTGGGLLVPPDSVEALADGLFTLWTDRGLRARLGDRGFDGVREHYSIQRSTDRLLEVYQSVIARGSGREVHLTPSSA
jgi:glycosyltransferase involved in cell wall biosynthesis